MTPSPMRNVPESKGPFWRPDATERMRAMLPEFVASVTAMTCLAVAMEYRDGTNVVAALVASGMAQFFVQALLYVCTYLVANTKIAYLAWMPVAMLIPIFGVMAVPGGQGAHTGAGLSVSVGAILGIVLFYLTRTRPTFVLLAIEILYLSEEIAQKTEVLSVHIVSVMALAALFVIRNSATRVTMGNPFVLYMDDDTDSERASAGAHGQVATLAAAVGALCLSISLAGAFVFGQIPSARSDTAASSVEAHEGEQSNTPGSINPSEQGGEQGGDSPATAPEGSAETESTAPISETGDHTQTEGESSAAAERIDDSDGNPRDAAPRDPLSPLALALALLLLLVIAPFPIRLLQRERTRRRVQSEYQSADRVARIYIGIIERLEAADIVRDEAETPREFLARRGQELEELTAPAGLGLDAWATLTDAYERARYAMSDPTEEELEICWRLYDALPACMREKVGRPRYLADAFWRM